MNIFQEVKERISMPKVVSGYGIDINRSGFCLCPFHNEKTPSMKIYEKSYKCFGCGEGGDMFTFVQNFFNLSSIYEAAKKINQDFGLNIPIETKYTKQEFESTSNIVQERKFLEEKEKTAFTIITDYHKILMEYGNEYRPQLGEVPDIRFIEYLTEIERCEMVFDEMLEISSKPLMEKQSYFNDLGDYISHIAERLNNANKSKARETEMNEAFATGTVISSIASQEAFKEGNIIGTVLYRAIPQKSYLKYPNIVAPQIAQKLEDSGIAFSGRVYSKLTTFTVSKADLNKVRNAAREITDKFTERNQPQIIPTEKQQKQQKEMPAVKKPAMEMSI